MKSEDFEVMKNPAVALYCLALSEALVGVVGSMYDSSVPREVQEYARVLVDYFRDQLPEDGFTVTSLGFLF